MTPITGHLHHSTFIQLSQLEKAVAKSSDPWAIASVDWAASAIMSLRSRWATIVRANLSLTTSQALPLRLRAIASSMEGIVLDSVASKTDAASNG